MLNVPAIHFTIHFRPFLFIFPIPFLFCLGTQLPPDLVLVQFRRRFEESFLMWIRGRRFFLFLFYIICGFEDPLPPLFILRIRGRLFLLFLIYSPCVFEVPLPSRISHADSRKFVFLNFPYFVCVFVHHLPSPIPVRIRGSMFLPLPYSLFEESLPISFRMSIPGAASVFRFLFPISSSLF